MLAAQLADRPRLAGSPLAWPPQGLRVLDMLFGHVEARTGPPGPHVEGLEVGRRRGEVGPRGRGMLGNLRADDLIPY